MKMGNDSSEPAATSARTSVGNPRLRSFFDRLWRVL
jgi:hypothetical protein